MESRETPYMNAQGERKIEVFLSNFQSKNINFREGKKKKMGKAEPFVSSVEKQGYVKYE